MSDLTLIVVAVLAVAGLVAALIVMPLRIVRGRPRDERDEDLTTWT